MNILDDKMLVYRVAKYYYLDGIGQNEIAKIVGVSRPQISRIIKRAQESGIVKIEVTMPDEVNIYELEKELGLCLGINSAVIISTEKDDNFFSLAAQYVMDKLENCVNIGVGWGKSIYSISCRLPYQTGKEQCFFYPLVGCSGDSIPFLQINGIIDRFAEHCHAKAKYLNLPVFLGTDKILPENVKNLKLFRKHWGQLDAAVVGIGGPELSGKIYISEVADHPDIKKRKEDIEGDILAHLLLKDGGELELEGYTGMMCSLESLKKIPHVIGVAKGEKKADMIYRVSQEGYINTLITDKATAKVLLKKYELKK